MSAASYTHIAWTDLETTGLDSKRDELLEVGIVLTDLDLNVISESSWVVRPKKLDVLKLHPTVREMHTKNGLLDAVIAKNEMQAMAGSGGSSDVDFEIVGWLRGLLPSVERDSIALGGSGVSHFDVRWIQRYLPQFNEALYRSTLDVGVIRRFIESVVQLPGLVPVQHRDLNHRALDDARQHLAEARWYRDLLRGLRARGESAFGVSVSAQ